jgi:hypothetical protein
MRRGRHPYPAIEPSLKREATAPIFGETNDSRVRLIGSDAIMGRLSETDDSRVRLIGSDAIMGSLSETDDSRVRLVGSDAIMV